MTDTQDPKDLARRLREDEKVAPLRFANRSQGATGFLPSNRLLAADMLERQAARIHALESQLYDARNDVRALQLSYKARQDSKVACPACGFFFRPGGTDEGA